MAYVITDECVSCGTCAGECPVEAISEGDDKYVIDADTCVDCGTCAGVCPTEAIVEGQDLHNTETSMMFCIMKRIRRGRNFRDSCLFVLFFLKKPFLFLPFLLHSRCRFPPVLLAAADSLIQSFIPLFPGIFFLKPVRYKFTDNFHKFP